MFEIRELDLVKSFLTARGGSPSHEEEEAWQNFFDVHGPLIWNLAKNYADRLDDAEDLFQDVWTVLLDELPKFTYDPERGPLHAWVIAVARRAALRAARRLRRNRTDALAPELADVLVDSRPDPMIGCVREEERQRVRSILAKLGAKQSALSHRITVLHWIDGQSVPEIAVALTLSEDRVRMRLYRALNKLKRRARVGDIQTNEK